MIDDVLGGEQQVASSKPMLQDYKKFKQDKEVSQEDEFNILNNIYWYNLSCTTNMWCICHMIC